MMLESNNKMEIPKPVRNRARSTGQIYQSEIKLRRASDIYVSPNGLTQKSYSRLATIRASRTELHTMMRMSVLTINELDSDFEETINRYNSVESRSSTLSLKRSHDYDPGEEMFSCQACRRRFYHKASLQAHMVLHSKRELRLRCRFCKTTFSKKWKLRVHNMLKHLKASCHL